MNSRKVFCHNVVEIEEVNSSAESLTNGLPEKINNLLKKLENKILINKLNLKRNDDMLLILS
jgi:hypothetical protein